MVRFQPSFSFWPRPRFLGESHQGLAAWIVDRDASLHDKHDVARDTAIQRIIDNHHDENGQTIEPAKSNDA
jgi:inorganic pyrophosphatase/exopolyphosphatase